MRGEEARLCSATVSISTLEKPASFNSLPIRAIVVPVRRACQKARRIVRKHLSKSIRHIIRKNVLFDAIPHIEQKMSSALQDAPCFAVARYTVRKEHRAKLAANEIKDRILERQSHSIRLPP